MLRHVCRRLLVTKSMLMQRASYQNYVMSDALAQIEKDCERYCPVPRFPPQKVYGCNINSYMHRSLLSMRGFFMSKLANELNVNQSGKLGKYAKQEQRQATRVKPQGTASNIISISGIIVTVVGAGSDVGRIVSLFLKQQTVIKVLAMYDDVPERVVLGVANDLAHMDTSPAVEAYQGRIYLKDALDNADVVVICGGHYMLPPCCNMTDRELFFYNMQLVRTVTLACAQFCPYAIIAIQTPPVDCNFALAMHTLKLARVYNKRKLLGVNAINAMRANQLFCSITGSDPSGSQVPVICGTGRCTRVPVFSAGKAGNFPQTQVDCLTRLVREADEIICKVKSNNEQGHLSIGFSTARFVTNIMKGLFVKPTFIDSALVEQADPEKCYKMPICATPVTVGKGGIVEYAIPNLNEAETRLLEESRCDLEDMLNLGRCYAVGDEYYLHPCKICYYPVLPCETCLPCKENADG